MELELCGGAGEMWVELLSVSADICYPKAVIGISSKSISVQYH